MYSRVFSIFLCPRVVFCFGSQNNQVKEFLLYRRVVKSVMEKMHSSECLTRHEKEKQKHKNAHRQPCVLTTQTTELNYSVKTSNIKLVN